MSNKIIAIGDRRELFVDDYLVASLKNLNFELHHPVKCEMVLDVNAPHENSNASNYASVVQDGSRYLFYYRAGGCLPVSNRPDTTQGWCLCVAESSDGIHWTKPILNILPEGPNVVFSYSITKLVAQNHYVMPAVTSVFLDNNPECPSGERFKLLVTDEEQNSGSIGRKLYLYTSGDGFHFHLFNPCGKPFDLDTIGDSQNTLCYDENIRAYRLYHRTWQEQQRTISMSISRNLEQFSENKYLEYDDPFGFSLYTNAISSYFRAPHILVGFPARYVDYEEKWDMSIFNRPGFGLRAERAKQHIRYGTVSTDTLFMASRDGLRFHRYPEAFIRPGIETENSWVYGDAEVAHGIVQTKSLLGNGAPDDLSFYVVSGSWSPGYVSFRRMSLRLDGFVSLRAPAAGGELVTKPFTFNGGNLTLNVSTSAFGRISVEFMDENKKKIPGYTLEDCYPGSGDSLAMTMRWHSEGGDVRKLAGKVIRLRFVFRDADLYGFKFEPYTPDPVLPDLGSDNRNELKL